MREAGGELLPFVSFEGADPKNFLIRVYFPLLAAVAGKDDIQSVTMPAERMAFCMYLGAYDDMMPVHEDMYAWFGKKGYPRPTISYETYYNGPEYPVEQLLTRVAMPLPWRR